MNLRHCITAELRAVGYSCVAVVTLESNERCHDAAIMADPDNMNQMTGD